MIQDVKRLKKMNKKLVMLLILCTVILSGCWDSKEAGRMFYIYGVGVDFKDDEYHLYAQLIDFASIAKSEQPPNPDIIQAEIGHANAKTLNEAFFKLYQSLDEELYWGHLTYLVFSEDVLHAGKVSDIMNTFTRFNDTRYQTWVYATRDPVKDVMLTKPILNKAITLSKLSDPLNSYKQYSFIEPINIRKLIVSIDEPNYEVRLPLVTLTKIWKSEKGSNTETAINGIGIVTPHSFKGFLTNEQISGLQWLSNETIRTGISIDLKPNSSSGNEEKRLSVVLEKNKVKIKPIDTNGDVKFDINVEMVAIVSGFQGNISEPEVQKIIEGEVKKQIKKTYEEGLNIDADVYQLSNQLYRKEAKKWNEIQKGGDIKLTDDSIRNIHVKVKVNSGRKSLKETIGKKLR